MQLSCQHVHFLASEMSPRFAYDGSFQEESQWPVTGCHGFKTKAPEIQRSVGSPGSCPDPGRHH